MMKNRESNEIVSVIIVTAGKSKFLGECINSAFHQEDCRLEVILIDNSADLKLKAILEEKFPDLKIYSFGKNLFYPDALNIGIKNSSGDFILCLNDDVILGNSFMQQALKGFLVDSKIGIVSGKIMRPDNLTIDSAGLFLSYCFSAKERGYGRKDRRNFEKEGFIFGSNGAALFFKREMLENIKIEDEYLDSQFRMFYEDLDICWRARNKGWKSYYMPKAIAYHHRGLSARKESVGGRYFARRFLNDELLFYLMRNRYLTVIKNASVLNFILHLPGVLFYDLFSWGYCLIFRFQAFRLFFKNIKDLKHGFGKRKACLEK